MSVIARWAATPRICGRPKPVMACTGVAPPAASASGSSSSGRGWLITRSITHLEEAGRTRPARRVASISADPTPLRPRGAGTGEETPELQARSDRLGRLLLLKKKLGPEQ